MRVAPGIATVVHSWRQAAPLEQVTYLEISCLAKKAPWELQSSPNFSLPRLFSLVKAKQDCTAVRNLVSHCFCDNRSNVLILMFLLLSRFIQEIEMNMGPGQAKQCQLRAFLTYYINDLFLNQVGRMTDGCLL